MNWQHIFINPQRHVLRSGWRVSIFFLLLIVLANGLGLAAGLIIAAAGVKQDPGSMASPVVLIIEYLLFITAALIASAVCLRAFDGRPLRSIGYQLHTGWWRDYVIGVGMAAAMITALVGIERFAGAVALDGSRGSINKLLSALVVSVIFFNIQSASEEIVFRGYPLQTLLCDLPPVWAVIITSAPFGLLHAANPHASILGILNTILAGVWLAVAYLKTRNLWLCTGLHWSWNWTMNAIYGLNVSGVEGIVKSSVFGARQTGPAWFTGGSYGPEGGLLATVVVSLGTIVLWRARWLAPSPDGRETLPPSPTWPVPGSPHPSPVRSSTERNAERPRPDQ